MAFTAGPITVTLTVRAKWWMRPAIDIACIALWLGLVRDKESAEHWDDVITAEERIAKWLTDFAFVMEVR